MDRDALNLEQLRIFALVAELGSFSAAARRLNRAQSAITYAIQKLEGETGLTLFDRDAYRPVLSEAGKALLPRARRVLEEAAQFRAQAKALAGGLEPELSLVVDAMFPMDALVGALAEFQARFPSVRTRMAAESLGAATDRLLEGAADLGLVIAFAGRSDALVGHASVEIEFTPVAAPGHPLAQLPAPITPDDARDHLQLVLTDRSYRTQGEDHGVLSLRTWRLADLGAKHALLLAGLGWGSMPHHMVQDDLKAGRLVMLPFEDWDGRPLPVRLPTAVTRRKDRVLGPAGTWLFERLRVKNSPG